MGKRRPLFAELCFRSFQLAAKEKQSSQNTISWASTQLCQHAHCRRLPHKRYSGFYGSFKYLYHRKCLWAPRYFAQKRYGKRYFRRPSLSVRKVLENSLPFPSFPHNKKSLKPHRFQGFFMVSHRGFEPRAPWLKVKCSANWANGSYLYHRTTLLIYTISECLSRAFAKIFCILCADFA